jgi:hypothetical protein
MLFLMKNMPGPPGLFLQKINGPSGQTAVSIAYASTGPLGSRATGQILMIQLLVNLGLCLRQK